MHIFSISLHIPGNADISFRAEGKSLHISLQLTSFLFFLWGYFTRGDNLEKLVPLQIYVKIKTTVIFDDEIDQPLSY